MACACNSGKKTGKTAYVLTTPSGAQTSYSTKTEAEAARLRLGGTIKPA